MLRPERKKMNVPQFVRFLSNLPLPFSATREWNGVRLGWNGKRKQLK